MQWTEKMRQIVGDEFISSDTLNSLARPRLSSKDLENLMSHDPALQVLLHDQQCVGQAVTEEFLLSSYCVHVLKDRQKRTKIFLEESEQDIKALVSQPWMDKYAPALLNMRKNEVFPQSEEYRDRTETFFHQISATLIASKLGKMMGLNSTQLRELETGMFCHDIGKLLIPWEIVNKNAALTQYERQIMEIHPEIGHAIISASGYDMPEKSMDIVLMHHERPNGEGYPNGTTEVPYLARIASVADVFDALISNRPYRKAPFTVHNALDMMIEGAKAKALDKDAVDCLVAANRETREMPGTTSYYH